MRTPFRVTPTVTAGAYSISDVIGGRLQFSGVRSGSLQTISIADNAAQNVDYRLVLFSSVPTDITDNATFDVADADLKNIMFDRTYTAATYRKAFTDNSHHLIEDLDVELRSEESDGDWWGFLIAVTAPTYAATSDVTVTLWVDV